ncbi:MAG: alpha-N-arabinofuranosidase [Actinocatenispora sp.]
MQDASFTLDPDFRLGTVDPRLYGSFVEHLGRCVYEGIVEPGHPAADGHGFRTDVLDLVRELGVTVVRYPGGNFVSGYRWEDGIGPVEQRPRRLDAAWSTTEPNTVGTDEFVAWCRRAGVEPMFAVNLGTRGIDAARALVEYSNHPGGSHWSDLRVTHGARDPHDIRLWCLGNEMDGPWQVGHKTAGEYGRLAAETAKAMRLLDPNLELVACGSSNARMPTFGAWEAEVLRHTYEYVDYISLHSYYQPHDGDLDSFLASAVEMDSFIDDVVATCDHVRAVTRSTRRIDLSFDEWNVWYTADPANAGRPAEPFAEAPHLLENVYSAADAVVVGSLLNSLLRHADRVRIACLAQLVNVIAPIATRAGGPAWRQTIFHPFALTARYGRGVSLRLEPRSPMLDTDRYGPAPVLDAAATWHEETGAVTVFAVNRSRTEPLALRVNLRADGVDRVVEHLALHDEDPDATNTAEQPDRVRPRPVTGTRVVDGELRAELPPLSWSCIRLGPVTDRS